MSRLGSGGTPAVTCCSSRRGATARSSLTRIIHCPPGEHPYSVTADHRRRATSLVNSIASWSGHNLIAALVPSPPPARPFPVLAASARRVQLEVDWDSTSHSVISSTSSLRRLVLDQLYIGELDVAPGEEMEVVEYEDDLAEGQFYQVLKRRVEKYFRGNEARDSLCSAAGLDWSLAAAVVCHT